MTTAPGAASLPGRHGIGLTLRVMRAAVHAVAPPSPGVPLGMLGSLVRLGPLGHDVTHNGTDTCPQSTAARHPDRVRPRHRQTAGQTSRAPALGKTSLAREGGQDVCRDAAYQHAGSGVRPLDPESAVPAHRLGDRGSSRRPGRRRLDRPARRPRPGAHRAELGRRGRYRRPDRLRPARLGQPALRGDRGAEPPAATARAGRTPRAWASTTPGPPPAATPSSTRTACARSSCSPRAAPRPCRR